MAKLWNVWDCYGTVTERLELKEQLRNDWNCYGTAAGLLFRIAWQVAGLVTQHSGKVMSCHVIPVTEWYTLMSPLFCHT